MYKFIILFINICFTILVSCQAKVSWTEINGNPSEILGKERYDKLIEKYEFVGNFQEGCIIIKDKKCGLLDFKGDEVLPCIYDTIYSPMNNIWIIKKDNKYGLVGKEANLIAECKFDTCLRPSKKSIPVCLHKKWGFINDKGENLISFRYDKILEYNDSVFIAFYNNKVGIGDYKNNILLPFAYDNVESLYDKDGFIASLNGKALIINRHYKQVTKPLYDCGSSSYSEKNGYISLAIPESQKNGLVEIETGKIIIPFEYDDIGNFSEGLIRVRKNKKYAYLNLKNQIVIPFIYDDAKDFSEGLAEVGIIYKMHRGYIPAKHYGFIDTHGKIVIPISFADQTLSSGSGFHDGLASIGIERDDNIFAGKEGYINKQGKFVIIPKYDSARDFFKGVAVVNIDGKVGVINKKAEFIIPLNYDDGFINESTSEIVMLTGDKFCYYSIDGKLLRTE